MEARPDAVVPTTNEALEDAATRHAVYIQRLGGANARAVVELLDEADRDLVARLTARIDRLGPLDRQQLGRGLATTQRLKRMLEEIRQQNAEVRRAVAGVLDGRLEELAEVEIDIASRRINEAVGVDLGMLRPSPELLRAATEGAIIRGQTLKQWWGKWGDDRLRRVDGAIRLGVIEGDTTPQIAKRLREGLDVQKRSADMLARTATNAVANQARDYLYEANRDILKGIKWVSTLDGKTSRICSARDGKIFPVDSGPRPPAHPNCLPGDTLVLARDGISSVSKRWFDGEVVVIRTASGRELTCTPNHPILTDRGWVAANALDLGSKVICDGGAEWPASGLLDGDGQHAPALIHEVAEAFLGASEVAAVPVPTSAEDFHGDGMDGEVAIVGSDRRLVTGVESALSKHGGELDLDIGREIHVPVLCGGTIDQLFEGALHAAHCVVSRANHALALIVAGFGPAPAHLPGGGGVFAFTLPSGLGCFLDGAKDAPLSEQVENRRFAEWHVSRNAPRALAGEIPSDDLRLHLDRDDGPLRLLGRREPLGLGGGTDGTTLAQNAIDGGDTDTYLARQIARGAAGPVFADDVVDVQRQRFSGHVYNLQTPNWSYSANGIVTHNCRSTTAPITKSWEELAGPNAKLRRGRGGENFDTIFQKRLAAKGFSPEEISKIKARTRASMTGQTAGDQTYTQWLRKSPVEFQNDVLGPTKAELFRKGELHLDKFVDMRSGREFTLDELRQRESEAWAKAFAGQDD